jgi:glycosyltransferase involved in cell wall biosynthesis
MVETGGWGGIAHYAWNLCQALAGEGADVCLLTNERYELGGLPRAFRVEPCFAAGIGYLRTVRRFLGRLEALAPDVVHLQSLLSTRFDAFLWPLVRRRAALVATAHNVRSHEGLAWEAWTTWRALRAAQAVVVHTQESAQVAARRLGPGARIAVIHQGDYAFFAPGAATDRAAARRRLGLPLHGPLLLMFGAIRPYKGILGAIAAFPQIRRRNPDVHLVIAGPFLFGAEAEYRHAIERAGVGDAVTFRPEYVPHGEVAAYFRAADVALYNYFEVTDSASLRVACSMGTPVVATAVGAFAEFLTDGATARLVPPNDPASLAAAVGEMLADPARAARMAEAARALAASAWSWAESARATLELYGTVLPPVSLAAAVRGAAPKPDPSPVSGGADPRQGPWRG